MPQVSKYILCSISCYVIFGSAAVAQTQANSQATFTECLALNVANKIASKTIFFKPNQQDIANSLKILDCVGNASVVMKENPQLAQLVIRGRKPLHEVALASPLNDSKRKLIDEAIILDKLMFDAKPSAESSSVFKRSMYCQYIYRMNLTSWSLGNLFYSKIKSEAQCDTLNRDATASKANPLNRQFGKIFENRIVSSYVRISNTKQIETTLDTKVIADANANMGKELMLFRSIPSGDFILVDDIGANSILNKAGIQNKDQIFSVNEIKTRVPQDFYSAISGIKNAKKCEIILMRNNEMVLLNVTQK